ncbi:MAG: WG repeat-containing protein [candidate division WOR-3 bacterium]
MDKTGKYVINPQFDDASFFSKGRALVKFYNIFGPIRVLP